MIRSILLLVLSFLNICSGVESQQFLTAPPIEVKSISLAPRNPTFADVTEDGNLDLFLEESFFQFRGKSGTVVSLNKDFSIRSTINLPIIGIGIITPVRIFPTNINSDLFIDLIVFASDGKCHTLINQGYNKIPKFVAETKNNSILPVQRFEVLEVKVSEIIEFASGKDLLWVGGIKGIFTPPRNTGLYITFGDNQQTHIIADGDKFAFRAVKMNGFWSIISLESYRISLHQQFAKGLNFSTANWNLLNSTPAVAIGDLNEDSRVDILIAEKQKLFVRLGTQYTFFGTKQEISIGINFANEYINDIACKDINNDGRDDIIISTTWDGRLALYYYENNGNLQFTKHTILKNTPYITRLFSGSVPGNTFPRQIDLIDIDSNGSLDIVISDIQKYDKALILLIKNTGTYKNDPNQFGTGTPKINPPTISLLGKSLRGRKIGITLNSNSPNSVAILHFGSHIFKNLIGLPIIPWLDIRVFPVFAKTTFITDKYGRATQLVDLPKSFPYNLKLGFQWLVIDLKDFKTPIHSSKALETILK